jgi:small-conductance mechanosensitive channel
MSIDYLIKLLVRGSIKEVLAILTILPIVTFIYVLEHNIFNIFLIILLSINNLFYLAYSLMLDVTSKMSKNARKQQVKLFEKFKISDLHKLPSPYVLILSTLIWWLFLLTAIYMGYQNINKVEIGILFFIQTILCIYYVISFALLKLFLKHYKIKLSKHIK